MKLILGLILSCAIFSCGKKSDDSVNGTETTEAAQQVGDVMASIDEVGGNGGTITWLEHSAERSFARFAPQELERNYPTNNATHYTTHNAAHLVLPSAEAASCSTLAGNGTGYSVFSTCANNAITRTFNGCTVHDTVTYSGTVVNTWGNGASACSMASTGQWVTRVPNFTVQGRRGAVLTVTKTGIDGERLTLSNLTPRTYSYTNDGIERKFTTSAGTALFDFTTTTSGAISVTGAARINRIVDGGSLRVKNNLTNVTCTMVPSQVTWAVTTCNCATQGTWSGSCDDGNGNVKTSTLALTGCGTGDYTEGTTTAPVTFDRCGI